MKRVGNKGIGQKGAEAARTRAKETAVAVRSAMRRIELDIEAKHGVYAHNGGNVTAAEVLRRAGKNVALLAKPQHRPLRDEVNAWVERVRGKIAIGAEVVRKVVTERADAASAEADAIRQRWVEAELEYVAAQEELREKGRRLRDLEVRCSELEAENARFRAAAAGENVVPLVRPTDAR